MLEVVLAKGISSNAQRLPPFFVPDFDRVVLLIWLSNVSPAPYGYLGMP